MEEPEKYNSNIHRLMRLARQPESVVFITGMLLSALVKEEGSWTPEAAPPPPR